MTRGVCGLLLEKGEGGLGGLRLGTPKGSEPEKGFLGVAAFLSKPPKSGKTETEVEGTVMPCRER